MKYNAADDEVEVQKEIDRAERLLIDACRSWVAALDNYASKPTNEQKKICDIYEILVQQYARLADDYGNKKKLAAEVVKIRDSGMII